MDKKMVELGILERMDLSRLVKIELKNSIRLSKEIAVGTNEYEGLRNAVHKDIEMYKKLLEKLGY